MSSVFRSITAVAAVLIPFSGALADGMPSGGRAPASYDSGRPWSGLYLGLHAGGGWGDTDLNFPVTNFYTTAPNQGLAPNLDGWIYGGHIGYNFQIGSFVFGPEVSYSGTTLQDAQIGGVSASFPDDSFKTSINDLLTVTGRLGFAVSRDWLLYARGGWARSEATVTAYSGPPVPNVDASWKTHLDGWTAGGGVEFKVGQYGVLGLEYNYVKLNSETVSSKSSLLSPIPLTISDTDFHTIQARFSILLNRDERPLEPLK